MTQMYEILTYVGWAWLVLVATYLVIRFTILRRATRGFDVAEARADVPPRPDDRGTA